MNCVGDRPLRSVLLRQPLFYPPSDGMTMDTMESLNASKAHPFMERSQNFLLRYSAVSYRFCIGMKAATTGFTLSSVFSLTVLDRFSAVTRWTFSYGYFITLYRPLPHYQLLEVAESLKAA